MQKRNNGWVISLAFNSFHIALENRSNQLPVQSGELFLCKCTVKFYAAAAFDFC